MEAHHRTVNMRAEPHTSACPRACTVHVTLTVAMGLLPLKGHIQTLLVWRVLHANTQIQPYTLTDRTCISCYGSSSSHFSERRDQEVNTAGLMCPQWSCWSKRTRFGLNMLTYSLCVIKKKKPQFNTVHTCRYRIFFILRLFLPSLLLPFELIWKVSSLMYYNMHVNLQILMHVPFSAVTLHLSPAPFTSLHSKVSLCFNDLMMMLVRIYQHLKMASQQ